MFPFELNARLLPESRVLAHSWARNHAVAYLDHTQISDITLEPNGHLASTTNSGWLMTKENKTHALASRFI